MTQTAREYCHMGRRQELTPEGNEKAKEYYNLAIGVDPQYLPAYAELSYVYVRECQNGWGKTRSESLDQARFYADEAVRLSRDSNSGWLDDFRGLWYRAIVFWNEGDFASSFQAYADARALITDPERIDKDTADLDADMAEAYIYFGDPQKAIDLILDAMTRYPDFPYWHWWNLARAYYAAERYQDAIDAIEKIAPNDVRLIVAASKAQLGETTYAQGIMAEFSKNDPDWTVEKSAAYRYDNDGVRQHWLDGLRMAGLKET